MKRNKTNFQKVVMVLNPNYARPDHYDGINAIYRLTAFIELDDKLSQDGFEKQLKKLVKDASKLEVRSHSITVHDDMFEINWFPRGYQMVMNRGQYAGLVPEFAKFRSVA